MPIISRQFKFLSQLIIILSRLPVKKVIVPTGVIIMVAYRCHPHNEADFSFQVDLKLVVAILSRLQVVKVFSITGRDSMEAYRYPPDIFFPVITFMTRNV